PRALSFARALRDPMRAQRETLSAALAQGRDTAYGREHGLGDATDPASFARRVPILRPDDLAPWVARQMQGESRVLSVEDPVYFVRTTGSTGTPKHVPITRAYVGDFQKTVHVALWHLHRRFPRAFLGRALYFVGSRRVDETPSGVGIGTMSGFNFTELPPVVRAVYAWPYELFEVGDLDTRTWLSLHLALIRDVSLVAGIFPAPVVYLLRELERRGDELAHHVVRGTLPSWLRLDDTQRRFFEAAIPPRPDLEKALLAASRAPVEEKVRLALPKLRLVYCWTTASAALYVKELRRRVGAQVTIRDAIYSACESWASIPMGDEEPGGPLAIQSGYYELVDEARVDAVGDPRNLAPEDFRTIADVEDGRRYYLVPTTTGGLYRYWLGDVVEVRGFEGRTPRIVFVRKGGAATNLAGEKLDEAHVNAAVGAALTELGLDATWFCMTPDPAPGSVPGYVLHVELREGTTLPASLGERVDARLRAGSFDYDRVRGSRQLVDVRIAAMPPGSYAAHRQARVASGNAEAQLKIAHLAERLPADLAARV
ncbi:MAG: GH3 auxin-responsive promoter family protein, partial [Myxococcales bacterium]|nr:GH3 auxin-responsive promoter family protein [Myxococcales bacterium]